VKYLKRYNETHDISAQCEELTGYSISELISIFEINLEDNVEFDVTRVTAHVMPHNIFDQWNETAAIDVDRQVVFIELTEGFVDNKEVSLIISKRNSLTQYADKIEVDSKLEKLLCDVNKKLLYMIGRKYDLKIGKVILRGSLDIGINANCVFRIGFTVEKDDDTAQ
jgi:hypothetical protein